MTTMDDDNKRLTQETGEESTEVAATWSTSQADEATEIANMASNGLQTGNDETQIFHRAPGSPAQSDWNSEDECTVIASQSPAVPAPPAYNPASYLPATPAVPAFDGDVKDVVAEQAKQWKIITIIEILLIIAAAGVLAWLYGLIPSAGNKQAVDFIIELYNNRLYEDETFLEQHCSEQVLLMIKNSDGTIDPTVFRSSELSPNPQNPAQYQIVSVEETRDGWYTYKFIDRGWNGEHNIYIVTDGDRCVIDKILP